MIQAYSEQLITIDELRTRIPHLRAREANLRGQIDALDVQAAYLTLAGNMEHLTLITIMGLRGS